MKLCEREDSRRFAVKYIHASAPSHTRNRWFASEGKTFVARQSLGRKLSVCSAEAALRAARSRKSKICSAKGPKGPRLG